MVTNRIIPPSPEQLTPEEAPDSKLMAKEQERKEQRKLNSTLRAASIAQIIMGAAVVVIICYVAKLVLVTLLVSILIAFMLDPVVNLLERIRLPRPIGSFLAVLMLMAAIYGCSYFLYARAVSFAHELPKYSDEIRGQLSHVRKQTSDFEKTSEQMFPEEKDGKKAMPVVIQNHTGPITENLGAVTEVALTLFFIPFLVYF